MTITDIKEIFENEIELIREWKFKWRSDFLLGKCDEDGDFEQDYEHSTSITYLIDEKIEVDIRYTFQYL